MSKPIVTLLLATAATLGAVSAAQAQQMEQRDQSRMTAQPQRPEQQHDQPRMLSRQKSLDLRAGILGLNNQITRAETGRRITVSQGNQLHGQIRDVERFYGQRSRDGLDRDEYVRATQQLGQIRTNLTRDIVQGERPRH